MARSKRLQLIVSEKEYSKLKTYAESQELSMSEILRDYIKSLPDTPTEACAEERSIRQTTSHD